MSLIIRKVNNKTDQKFIYQIWHEVGWIEPEKFDILQNWINNSRGLVAELNNRPECYVSSIHGNLKYQNTLLPFSCISGVTTSLIARKQNLAGKTTAQKIAEDVQSGATICGLGMFEQGYYNQLGFGTGTYEYFIHFSPSTLNIDIPFQVPERLSKNDLKDIQLNRENRLRKHGSCVLPKVITNFDVKYSKKRFGFGYRNKNGVLTHHIWLDGLGTDSGPINVIWMAYQNHNQMLELLALLRSFGDQIKLIKMLEPPGVYLQDFLNKPFYNRSISQNSIYMNQNKALSFWQMRISDLFKCIEVVSLPISKFSFNLKLIDPIEKFISKKYEWNGIAGNYIITIGSNSNCKIGQKPKLETLETTVNGFTRMWLGILPASIIKLSEKFSANKNLIQKLDYAFSSLPKPQPDWDF